MSLHLGPRVDLRIDDSPVVIEIVTGDQYLVSLEPPDDGSAQIRRWREATTFTFHERTGLFQAEGDYGTFAYRWPPHARGENLYSFVATCDFDYFMKKAAKAPYRMLDLPATLRDYKLEIIRARREEFGVSSACAKEAASVARERWDALRDLDDYMETGDEFMRRWHDDQTLYDWLYGPDVSYSTKPHPQALAFWNGPFRALLDSQEFARLRAETPAPERRKAA